MYSKVCENDQTFPSVARTCRSIGRVVNGRLTERWGLVSELSMLVQLDVIAAPGRVAVTV